MTAGGLIRNTQFKSKSKFKLKCYNYNADAAEPKQVAAVHSSQFA